MTGVGVTVGVAVAMGVAGRGVAVARVVGVGVMLAAATGVAGAAGVILLIGVASRPQPATIKLHNNQRMGFTRKNSPDTRPDYTTIGPQK